LKEYKNPGIKTGLVQDQRKELMIERREKLSNVKC